MKIRFALLGIAVAAFALVVGKSAVGAFNQPVKTVSLHGALSESERMAVQSVLGTAFPTRMSHLDLAALSDAVAKLDWIESVSMRRRWPNGLDVHVRKPTLVARWADGGYVSARGRLVRMADSVILADLPLLGVAHSDPGLAIERFEHLGNRVAEQGLTLTALVESASGEWTLTLGSDAAIRLGRSDLDRRLDRALTVLQGQLSGWASSVSVIDARYHNGVAVAWRDDTGSTPNTRERQAIDEQSASFQAAGLGPARFSEGTE